MSPAIGKTDQFKQASIRVHRRPVSCWTRTTLIELAVNLAGLIKERTTEVKFVVDDPQPFVLQRVLHNEFQYRTNNSTYRPRDCKQSAWSKRKTVRLSWKTSPMIVHSRITYFGVRVANRPSGLAKSRKYPPSISMAGNVPRKNFNLVLGYKNWGDLLPSNNRWVRRPITWPRSINLSSPFRTCWRRGGRRPMKMTSAYWAFFFAM